MFFRLLLLLLIAFTAKAQDQYNGENYKLSLKPYGSYALLSLELEPNTKTYWRSPGELGLATKINFNKSENLESTELFWPVPELFKDNYTSSYVYKGKTDFVIHPFAKDKQKNISLTVNIEFTTCREVCDNHRITLSTQIIPSDPNDKSAEIIQALAKTPKVKGDLEITSVKDEILEDEHYLRITVNSNYDLIHPKLFLDLPEYVQFDSAKFDLVKEFDDQVITIPISFLGENNSLNKVYINLVGDNGEAIEYETIIKNDHYSLFLIILYALLGGLILNVMPCVLPILALKTLQIVKLSGQEHNLVRKKLVMQAIGIIASFILVAMVTYFLQQAGRQVGFGFQFQQPFYLITMVVILSLIAISLVSDIVLNIRVPDFVLKLFPDERRDLCGFFLSGVLATMLALPCTAPFITIAVGFALTAQLPIMLLIFGLMGIGMAAPYIVLALFPKVGRFFPKPGEWLNKFKKFLGVIIFVTCLWLIYIISDQLGDKAAIILFLLIILIKFVLVEEKIFASFPKAIIIIILISLCYFMPYSLYEEKQKEAILIEDVWRDYNPKQINSLIAKDYIIVLDVTASWCPTCKVNKLTTLDNPIVMKFMKDRNIIGMRADITKGTTVEISTLMRMKKHYGIPLNIIYSKKFPQGVVLPTFLTPNKLTAALKDVS